MQNHLLITTCTCCCAGKVSSWNHLPSRHRMTRQIKWPPRHMGLHEVNGIAPLPATTSLFMFLFFCVFGMCSWWKVKNGTTMWQLKRMPSVYEHQHWVTAMGTQENCRTTCTMLSYTCEESVCPPVCICTQGTGERQGEELDIPYDKMCAAKLHIYTDFSTGQWDQRPNFQQEPSLRDGVGELTGNVHSSPYTRLGTLPPVGRSWPTLVFVSKALLEHSHVHSLTVSVAALALQQQTWVSVTEKGPQSWKYSGCLRRRLLPTALCDPIPCPYLHIPLLIYNHVTFRK